jgi:glutamate dehydrogenase
MADENLTKVQVFSSHSNTFAIIIFTFTPRTVTLSANLESAAHILSFVEEVRNGQHASNAQVPSYSAIFDPENLGSFVRRCSPEYIQNSSPRRFMIQRELYEKVRGSDNSAVHFENYMGAESMWYMGEGSPSSAWITIAAGNVLPEVLLQSASRMLSSRGIDITRLHLDQIVDEDNEIPADGDKPLSPGFVTMVRLLVSPNPSEPSPSNPLFGPRFIPVLTKDLKRAKWLDDSTMELGLVTCPQMGIDRAEVVTALACMLHGPLNKMVRGVFPSTKAIINEITSHPLLIKLLMDITELFLNRFMPGRSEAEQEASVLRNAQRAADITRELHDVMNPAAKIALQKMLEAVMLTLRTNFFFEDRWALSLRIDPIAMFTPHEVEHKRAVPYGVFFSHGRDFNGFHNRFRDIARGGLRIVTPYDAEARSLESTKHFDEVWGLSFAQQQKNKDIPEGGAKAVIQIDTPSIPKAFWDFTKRKSVRAFVDSVLDLIVRDAVIASHVVDYFPDTKAFNKDELVYLGPDEQVIVEILISYTYVQCKVYV